ncbi:MAG: HD domain-containing protein [Sulfurovum sp.]|nr:HD domain-containing protein [Sulfurovum sp.]MCB4745253.1 HD domain-containing protein [Sulfurovum sp.]MCB4746743.1 HD domain-containing protein [Sulfurovum sp.]MCB4749333.1 HD domain-containing protein [Sulfurovum sp.]MCB4750242.1 HD domain-containing protein [Sulfurovum sp.]
MDRLKREIEVLLYENATDFEIAKIMKKSIKEYFETLEETFANTGGKDFLVKHTKQIDTYLKIIYQVVLRSMFSDYMPMKNSIPIALVALGSYGREQLCVYSDIDLMIVYKNISGYNTKELIEKILYILWDAGLKLGHRVHATEELYRISKTDITIKTALIESRFIEGSHFIWTETQNAINLIRHDDIEGFIKAKLEEQAVKHKKFPLTMEPNLKEGVGGFRDANLIFWIGKVQYNVDTIKDLPKIIIEEKEYRTFRIALEFLFRVRSALHLATHKKEDKLQLDLIPTIASLLGYEKSKQGHLRFAKKVTESLKIIRLYSTIWLERLTCEYMDLPSEKRFIYTKSKDFNRILKYICKEGKEPFRAHPTFLHILINAKRPERPDNMLYKTIATIFYQPHAYSILGTLSYARLLHYTIPPIKKVIDLPQFDGYHQYAVDIHSLRCIYHLEHIEEPLIRKCYEKLNKDEKAMLKVVTFLHDSGKGRKRDHHYVGASLFKIFAQKLGMDNTLIRMGEQLIQYHTLMSNIAQREDLYNEKVIFGFASHFPTQKLLDMIYILTYADMNGVGDGIYNSFNAKLIRTLYNHSLEILGKTVMLSEAAKRTKKEVSLKRHPKFRTLKRTEQKKILQMPSNLLFLRYRPERIIKICQKAFETTDFTYHISNNEYLTIEIIRADSINLSYLLGKLSTLEIVNMDISKLFNELKYFKIDFASRVDEDEIHTIEQIIINAFSLTTKSIHKIPLIKKEDIDINCEHSKTYAIMHLRSKNQRGLLAYVIDMFDEMGVDIVTAKVHTLKNRVRDMFLIEKNGNFCHNMETIIEKLTIDKVKEK